MSLQCVGLIKLICICRLYTSSGGSRGRGASKNNVVLKMCFVNIYMQYSHTKYGNTEYFRSHLSIVLFPFFPPGERGTPPPCSTPLATSGLEQWVPIFYNLLLTNVFCQYLYTILPYKMQILECCRSHLRIFLFPFSFHLGRGGHPLPVPPGWYFGPRTMRTYCYNFVVTNVFCQYLYTT